MSILTLGLVPRTPAAPHHGCRCLRLGLPILQLLVLPLLVLSEAVPALGAQQAPPHSGRDVHMVIETSQSAYRASDTVRVLIAIKNVSSTPIGLTPSHHENDVKLIVATLDGQVVAPTLSFGSAAVGGGEYVYLRPQESWTWPSYPLSDWGYDLHRAGTYTIVGIPLVAGYGVAPDLKTVRSNRVTFTITP